MGLPAGQPVHARHRDDPHRRDDPRTPPPGRRHRRHRAGAGLIALALLASAAAADTLRLATWDASLSRRGPGLLLQDILSGRDAQVEAALRVIAALDADVLLLTGMDWDLDLVALGALADRLADLGVPYPVRLALPPNRGLATGIDLNGDGRLGTPDDAQGWGVFRGQGAMALLSRVPVDAAGVADLSGLLWRDLPGAIAPPSPPEVAGVQRLSSGGHWIVPLDLPGDRALTLLAFAATPPVFDGPEDRNGRRNHDEAALWLRLMDGALPEPPPRAPFVILGQANLDPDDAEGRPEALRALLADPRLQDVLAQGGAAPDTALFDPPLGGLRLDYVLPSADLTVRGAGVAEAGGAGRHRPVWVDIDLP
jgi:hypothetical protein